MSKYAALREHLSTIEQDRWVASFQDIEKILGFTLPQSARKYPAWWANQSTEGHSQTAGWLPAGWMTTGLSLNGQQVTFVKFDKAEKRNTTYKPSRVKLEWAEVLNAQEEVMRLKTEFGWAYLGSLALDSKNMITFPRTPVGPAVYRFRLDSQEGTAVYLGQTEEVTRRFQHYRTPGPTQRTNQWLNHVMKGCVEKGGCVEIDILSDGKLGFNDGEEQPELSCKFTRQLMENSAIVQERHLGRKVINK